MRIYLYSNYSKSLGVEKKISAQCELLEIVERISLTTTAGFFRLGLLIKCKELYVRESLATSILLFLFGFLIRSKLVVEANRIFSDTNGRRSKNLLRIRKVFSKYLFKKCHKIVCVTNEIKDSLEVFFPGKSVFIPNIYNFNLELNQADATKKEYDFLFLGSSEQSWNDPELINTLAETNPTLKILHIGEGRFVARNIEDIGYVYEQKTLEKNIKKCRVALSALGLRKGGRLEAYPLKHAEYVSLGIPTISGALDTMLVGDPAFIYLPAPTPKSILESAKELTGRSFDLETIQEKIKKHISVYKAIFD
jgi:hypothetical protein